MSSRPPSSIIAALLVALASGTAFGEASSLMHFSVTQVRQLDLGAPVVRAYLDVTDSAGRSLATLPASSLEATLGEWSTRTVDVAPFAAAEQGVAYVFLVDISKSLSPELFQRMAAAIETWVEGMESVDRAALIAFGESSRLMVDFTGEKDAILTALRSFGPTDDETLLHQALADALELSRRLDPDLPGRRAVIIFSDGKDEGSGFEAEDILAKLRVNPSPIYAIGYSRLRDPAERQAYLDLLQRFATNSAGVFFAAEETRFAAAYDSIREAIRRVWVADFLCADCRADGSLHRLQVQVTSDGQVLSSGGPVRLLPRASETPILPGTTTTEIPTPVATQEPASTVVQPPPPALEEDPVPTIVESPPAVTGKGSESPAVEDPLPSAPEPEAPPIGPPASARPLPAPSSFSLQPWLIGLAVLIMALVLWAALSRRRQRQFRGEPVAPLPQPPMPMIDPRDESPLFRRGMPARRKRVAARPYESEIEPEDLHPEPEPAPPDKLVKQVRLVVVQGSRKGRQYSLVVEDRAVVGRRSSCDCVLAEETGIDALQFELLNEEDGLFIENLSDRRPTMVEGQPLTDRLALSSNSLVGTSETVLRIVFH